MEQRIFEIRNNGVSTSLVELYLKSIDEHLLHKELALVLIRRGAKLSHSAINDMHQFALSGDAEMAQALFQRKSISEETYQCLLSPGGDPLSPQENRKKLLQAKMHLKSALLQLKRGNWEWIDLAKIHEYKKFKKTLKENPDLREQLREDYLEFVELYDQLINQHPVLKEFRIASQQLRVFVATKEKTPPPPELSKLAGLWTDGLESTFAAEDKLSKLDQVTRKRFWGTLTHRFFHFGNPAHLPKSFVVLIHGTKHNPAIFREGFLHPKGKLNETGLVPFSGELQGTDIGDNINVENISCSTFAHDFSDAPLLFNAHTPFLVSYLYANQLYGYGKYEQAFDEQLAQERLSPDQVKKCIKKEDPYQDIRELVIRDTDIRRLRASDPKLADQICAPILELVLKSKEQVGKNDYETWAIDRLYQALTIPLKHSFSEEDLVLIHKKIPVVFASVNASTGTLLPNTQERLFRGSLKLGSNIQFVFTLSEHIRTIENLATQFNMQVYSFETGAYLETRSMALGKQLTAFEASIQSLQEPEKRQRKIEFALNTHILPAYTAPLQENPFYLKEGKRHTIDNPFLGGEFQTYAEYLKATEEGTFLARHFHGRMHSTRVTILAQLLIHIDPDYSKLDPFLLPITAAAHDALRQDEGEDFWDEESADFLYSYLVFRQVPSEKAQVYRHAIAQKDPTDRVFLTKEQKIVQTADCLEIIRCLPCLDRFQKKRLAIPLEDTIIQEWAYFIKKTEDKDLKIKLENSSLSYYADVMRLLKHFSPKMPTVSKLLEEELQYYDQNDLPQIVSDQL